MTGWLRRLWRRGAPYIGTLSNEDIDRMEDGTNE